MRKAILRLCHFAVGLATALTLLVAAAAWRLSEGPIPAGFLTPVLERNLAGEASRLRVEIGETAVAWGGWQHPIDIQARDLSVTGIDGTRLVSLPEASVGLALAPLLRGHIAVERLDIHRLVAHIERYPDGSFAFDLPVDNAQPKTAEAGTSVGGALLALLRGDEVRLAALRTVSLVQAEIHYVDGVNNTTWTFPEVDAAATFHPNEVTADLRLAIATNGARTRLNGNLRFDRRTDGLSGEIRFRSVSPAQIARAVPQLRPLGLVRMPVSGLAEFRMSEPGRMAELHFVLRSRAGTASVDIAFSPDGKATGAVATLQNVNMAALGRAAPAFTGLAGIDIPVNGRMEATLDPGGAMRPTRVSLSGGAGRIEIPGFLPDAVSVRGIRLDAVAATDLADGARGELVFDFGGPKLTLSGAMHQVGDRYNANVNGRATNVAMATLRRYWPVGLGAAARDWVTANIVEGRVTEARSALILDAPVDDPLMLSVVSIAGTLRYDGLGVRFWNPMPPVKALSGTARFDNRRFDFAVAGGQFEGMVIDQGEIAIAGLDEGKEAIKIDLALRGPLRNVVQVIGREPLHAFEKLGVPMQGVSGEVVGHLNFAFPLLLDLDWDQIRFGASADLRNVTMSPTPYGVDLAKANLKLDLDPSGMTVRGHGHLDEVPMTIDWTEHFGDDVELQRRLTLSGRVADLSRPGFGLPDLDLARGPADVGVVLMQPPRGESELLATFELKDAEITVASLGVHKARGAPGTGGFTVRFGDGTKPEVERFHLFAEPLSISGSVRPHPHLAEAWRVVVDAFRNGDSGFGGRVDVLPDGAIDADLSGQHFDLTPLIENAFRDGEETPAIPIRLRGRFGQLVWGESGRLSGVDLQARVTDGSLHGLLLSATVGASGVLSLRLLPDQEGQVLRIDTDDLGSALRAIGASERVRGGSLVVRARRASPEADFRGDFFASAFTVRQAPVLARVLQVASLMGILDVLRGQGILFEQFSGGFAYHEGVLAVQKARGHGSSLGISVDGSLDLRHDRVDFSGLVVPAHTVGRVLGQIPLIGTLLTGLEGEGVFAASYRVEGSTDAPQVSVNPLSALAPGLLRDLFGLTGKAGPEAPSGTPPASPSEPAPPPEAPK